MISSLPTLKKKKRKTVWNAPKKLVNYIGLAKKFVSSFSVTSYRKSQAIYSQCVCVCVCVLVAQWCPSLCNAMDHIACQALQGIFLTQGLNLGLPHCRQILYHLNQKGTPSIYVSVFVCMLVAQLCLTLRPHGLSSPWNSLGQNTGVGSLSLNLPFSSSLLPI